MVTLTKAARAAILLIGAAAIAMPIAAPAKEKKKEEAAPAGPQLSPEFRKAAVPAQAAVRAVGEKLKGNRAADVSVEVATAEPLVVAAEASAKTEDDVYYKQVFRLQLEDLKLQASSKGDAALYRQKEGVLVEPLKLLLANPKTPPAERAVYANRLGEVAYESKNFAEASRLFEMARAAGSTNANLGLNIVRAKAEGGDIAGGIGELRKLIDAEKAAGRTAPEPWYLYARAKTNAAKMTTEFLDWSRLWLLAYPTAKNWREALIYYGFQGPYKLDKREKIDIFRLLRATKSLGDQNDYAEYAEDLFDVGLPSEAKAVIEEGRAAGKVPATGGPNAMILADATTAIKAEGSLDALAKRAAASPNGLSAAATGDAYLGTGAYAQAIELYTLALKKGGLTKPEEVTTHIGVAQALAGDKAAAKATFLSVKTAPRADIASFWITWLDSVPAA